MRRKQYRWGTGFISLLLLILALQRATAQLTVYSNDFESGNTAGWSTTVSDPLLHGAVRINTTPVGSRSFLGNFGPQAVRLALTSLPFHDSVFIEFDLFVIRSWDGNAVGVEGPDIWELSVDGQNLVHTTFNNHPTLLQAYPGTFPGGVFPSQSGATETNTLGFDFLPIFGDAVYHITAALPHTNNSLDLDLSAVMREQTLSLGNESWGVDNVRISVPPVTATFVVSDAAAAPGDTVEIPVILRRPRNIQGAIATTVLRYDASLLFPLSPTPMGSIAGRDRIIPLTLALDKAGDSVLTTLRFLAAVGDSQTIRLTLENTVVNRDSAVLISVPGRFTLTDLCPIPDVRLVDNQGTLALKPLSPNPVRDIGEIQFEIVEDGATRLYLVDRLGRITATLLDAKMSRGRYRLALDVKGFPSGAYHCVLQTPTAMLQQPLLIEK